MILDLSNLIGKNVSGNMKFESIGNQELLPLKDSVHNKLSEKIIIYIQPGAEIDDLPDAFTQINFYLFTNKRVYIGVWISYTKVTRVQIGHLIYNIEDNLWVKQ